MEIKKKNQEGGLFVDDRGVIRFINDFPPDIRRMYQVENLRAGMIRAFHGHKKEEKYVWVPRGIVEVKIISFDMVLDSPTYSHQEGLAEHHNKLLAWKKDNEKCMTSFVLSSFKPSLLHISAGYYNGFKTLTDDAVIQFYSTYTLEESKEDDFRLPWDHFGKEIWEEKPR